MPKWKNVGTNSSECVLAGQGRGGGTVTQQEGMFPAEDRQASMDSTGLKSVRSRIMFQTPPNVPSV